MDVHNQKLAMGGEGPSGGKLQLGGSKHWWCADQHGGEGRDEGSKGKYNALLTGDCKK